MRNGKLLILLMSAVFLLLAAGIGFMEPAPEPDAEGNIPLSVTAAPEGQQEPIACWADAQGDYVVFLPSWAEMGQVTLSPEPGAQVVLDGRPLERSLDCGGFQLDTAYSLSWEKEGITAEHTLTFLRSARLPSLHLDVRSGSMDIIHARKGNQETGVMRLYLPDGKQAYAGKLDSVNGRGNDWLIPKKSYSLQLAGGADLLGMGQAEKWILQANAFDASHLRNKLIYDFSAALGLAYSPESQWVDLYLNGQYAGLYLLCERNEIHPQRIRLEGEGRYLVSMDLQWRLEQNGRPFVTTESGQAFRIHDSQLGDSDLRQLLQSVENAICAEDGRDPLTGKHWTQLLDMDSWARKYLVEEIFGNGDGGAISQYFYGSADQPFVYAGPVWDYDISMGNTWGRCGGEAQAIFAGRPRTRSDIRCSWYYALYRQEAFYDRVTELYREECLPLLDKLLQEQLAEYLARILDASAMNQIRWETLEAGQTGASAEAAYIRRFMEARIAFLNRLWLEQEPFHWVLMDTNDGLDTICFAVRPGDPVPFLPEYTPAPEILGWYDTATQQPFDPSQPIYQDTVVYLKRLPGDDGISPVQAAPLAVGLVILLGMILTDGKRRMAQREKKREVNCQAGNCVI